MLTAAAVDATASSKGSFLQSLMAYPSQPTKISQESQVIIPQDFFNEENNPAAPSPPPSQESSFTLSPDPQNNCSPSWSPLLSQSSTMEGDFQSEIDPHNELSIWAFYENKNSDKIVKEYVELLDKNRYFPRVPDHNKLEQLSEPTYKLSKECSSNVVSTFTDYFQSRYFCKNTKGAIDANFAMATVHVSLQVPQYNQMPAKVFQDAADFKEAASLALQTNYCEGQLFVCELNLLRNFDFIITEVKANVNTDEDVDNDTNYFFLTHYIAAKTNFIQQYKMKVIDWTRKPKNNKTLLPFWRKKEGGSPPKFRSNRYASQLLKVISEGKAKLDSVSVLKAFEDCPPQKIKQQREHDKKEMTNREGTADTRPIQGPSGGYKTRNFLNQDHRKREFNTNRRPGTKPKSDRKRSGNPYVDANREKFMNHDNSNDSDNQAEIPKTFLQ